MQPQFAFSNRTNIDMLIEDPGSNSEEDDEEQPEWAEDDKPSPETPEKQPGVPSQQRQQAPRDTQVPIER